MIKHDTRIISFDVMRVIAAFAVVWQHICGQNWAGTFPSFEWDVRNFYASFAQWSVPMFIMISGALFLSPDKPLNIKRLFRKNLVRIICAFFFWSFIYEVVTNGLDNCVKILFLSVLKGPAHFWFLKIMIGLYLLIPILKPLTTNKQTFNYLVCLSIVTAVILPAVLDHIWILNEQWMILLKDYFDGFGVVSFGFASYFVLGHFLYTTSMEKHVRLGIYLFAIMSFVCSIICNHFYAYCRDYHSVFFYVDLHPFTFLESIGVFVFIKENCKRLSPFVRRVVLYLSNSSFGIFLVHPLFMYILDDSLSINSSSYNPLFFIPIYVILIFILSCLLVKGISYIPRLSKTII